MAGQGGATLASPHPDTGAGAPRHSKCKHWPGLASVSTVGGHRTKRSTCSYLQVSRAPTELLTAMTPRASLATLSALGSIGATKLAPPTQPRTALEATIRDPVVRLPPDLFELEVND